MSALYVCSLSRLVETIQHSGARHVASLVNAGMEVPYPLAIPLPQRLYLGFNDIIEEVPGLVAPEKTHVEKLIRFVEDWRRGASHKTPLVIHCWMGISRSTAGAYISQCALMPERDEEELAQALRAASPQATPNMRLVRFGDDLLARNGRMVRAIETIGRGADTFEGEPFSLPLA